MRKLLLLTILFLSISVTAYSQNMNNEGLEKVILSITDQVEGVQGQWRFTVADVGFICLTDQNNNRMRVMSPIAEVKDITPAQLTKSLEANFHSALDVKYAISEDVMWAVFIHPLKELTDELALDGIAQAFSAVKTFGTTYSSGALAFPTSEQRGIIKN